MNRSSSGKNDTTSYSYNFRSPDPFDDTLGDKLPPERVMDNGVDTKKILSSHADLKSWWRRGKTIPTTISRHTIARIARSSETVDAILRHSTDDIVGAGYTFVPKKGVKNPSDEQRKKVEEFFEEPNPDDQGDEWLSDFVYDYILFGDAYWEKTGDLDEEETIPSGKTNAWYGGELTGVWHVPCETMKLICADETGQMPDPESGKMVYEQENTNSGNVQFDSLKILRGSRFRRGRLYGQSPLLSLLNIIAGQINLTGYIGNLFKGNVPKHLINLGDVSPDEFDRLMLSMQEQLEQATNPFGVIAVNVPSGFELSRLMETNREGAFLETLDYYRQEICSVFGIPPTKMGWSIPGRIGSPEEMLDTWYDNVEHIHTRLEKLINRGLLPYLGITELVIKFNEIRPKKTRLEAQVFRDHCVGIKILRNEEFISPNEARGLTGFDPIDEDWAKDPQHPSPANKNPGGLGTPHAIVDQIDIIDMIDDVRSSIDSLKREVESNRGGK